MSTTVGIAILAAGKGTRLKIETPKALVPALGKPLVDYVINEGIHFADTHKVKSVIYAVIGHQKDLVEDSIKSSFPDQVKFAIQKEQRGTGDALKAYLSADQECSQTDYTFITCADAPLISDKVYERLYQEMLQDTSLQAVAASFVTEKPFGYGRIIHQDKGFKIVEEKEANEEEKKVKEVNSGFYLIRTAFLNEQVNKLKNTNNSGEFYLTDIFADSLSKAITFSDGRQFQGVNDLIQLDEVVEELSRRKHEKLMSSGVRLIKASSSYIEWDVEIGAGTVIYPQAQLFGTTQIAQNCTIEANCTIKNSQVGPKNIILANSYLEEVVTQNDVQIGPFARLRPKTILEEKVKVGNFVEIKKATLKAGAKASHLSYIGDAEIGEETNIGCGFITCNYDGAHKHKSYVGRNCFIGSDTQLIAPIEIGDEAFIAAGSTITQNVPSEGFAISRQKQVTKENMAKRFLKKKN